MITKFIRADDSWIEDTEGRRVDLI
uniref:Uncharacterized protein n=1 Tax=Rhizophora mucronata TaxID=61149 RepID=A0A2P2J7L1_RHIMU